MRWCPWRNQTEQLGSPADTYFATSPHPLAAQTPPRCQCTRTWARDAIQRALESRTNAAPLVQCHQAAGGGAGGAATGTPLLSGRDQCIHTLCGGGWSHASLVLHCNKLFLGRRCESWTLFAAHHTVSPPCLPLCSRKNSPLLGKNPRPLDKILAIWAKS